MVRKHLLHCLQSTVVLLSLVACSALFAREVRVGVYSNEPKIFLDSEGKLSGIFGDLLQAIAAAEDWTLKPVPCEWQACLTATQAGSIDLMPDVAFSEARAPLFEFHRVPALHSWSQIYQREGQAIESVLDLQGRRVAVLQGGVQQSFFANLVGSFGVNVQWVAVSNLSEGFSLVASGKADAVVASHQFGSLQGPRYKLVATPIMFQPSRLFFATGKGRNAELLNAIDRRLQAWQGTPGSEYFQVLARWGSEAPRTLVPKGVLWGLAGLTTLLALALGFAALLRRQVTEKTRHLRASEEKLRVILDSVDAHIYIKDTELRYQYANHKVCELFAMPQEQVVGRTDPSFFDPVTAENLRNNDLLVLQHGERVSKEETNTGIDGVTTRTFLSVKQPLRDSNGQIYALCGVSTDITELKNNREAIHQLAFYDALTQLPNRRLLLDRMQQTLSMRDRLAHDGALLYIDLDNFKTLNDTLGHDMGDQLLQQVAQRLSECTREMDTLARLGGDEFVVMLQGLSKDPSEAARQAELVAQKVVHTLAEPYQLGPLRYQNTVSLGIAMFSDPHSTQEELLKRADLAMYQAKADGRNALRFFNPEMQAQMSHRVALEEDLRVGLSEQQFLLYYQPQVDQHGNLLGAEVLLRWQHPQRGLVLPGTFIPSAESSGLILPLGRWILQAACMQLMAWSTRPELAHLTIAVNVSARQFRQPDFVQQVFAALDASGANASRLELELTESQLVDDIEGVTAKMTALKSRGVRLSLDDFGTGYSSLNYLKRLPIDQLKIDQSFVRDLLIQAHDAAIVKTIVALGQSLHMNVIAEGVETRSQRDALEALGCLHYQGYWFGRPGPIESLEGWTFPASTPMA
ncbi:MAG: EAL domain-containing protein [Rhodoferax sp.]|nr:EAL domain-containing protein [Rhodoferax sp.]